MPVGRLKRQPGELCAYIFILASCHYINGHFCIHYLAEEQINDKDRDRFRDPNL